MASSQVEDPFLTPRKIVKSPSLSSSSSSLSSPSSRKLPTPPSRQHQTTFICDVCNTKSTFNSNLRNLNSSSFPNVKVNDFDRDINLILNNLEYKTELVSKQIATIESSISNHNVVINKLERGIANLASKLSNMSYKLSTFDDFIASSSSVTLSKPSFSKVASNKTSSSNVALTKSSSPAYTYTHTCTSFPPIVRTSSASHNMIVKDPHRNRTTPDSRIITSVPPQKCSLLVLGDSNTKYVKFPNINYHRVPTYLIEDINPSLCIGHAKVWLHVGINNLKSIRCGGPNDVHKAYELFIHKIEQIRRLSPNTTVIVSPILPTGVSVLNDRARAFNRLLFSTRRWFISLNFNIFADRYSMLDKNFRCFNNPRDRIHLGYQGICELQRLIDHRVPIVDSRSYRAVAKSNIT